MNSRLLNLIKDPESIQIQDVELLNSEIKKYPYQQNIRALHLLGIHQFNPELYQQELSKTAAYTTDKKILYQFINKKNVGETQKSSNISEIKEVKKEIFKPEENLLPKEFMPLKPVIVNGEINRILFEGEEDFWEKEHQTIDLESTIESGKLVVNKINSDETPENRFAEIDDTKNSTPKSPISEEKTPENELITRKANEISQNSEEEAQSPQNEEEELKNIEEFSSETIIKEKEISKDSEILKDPSQVSFHGLQEFLPEIKISPIHISKDSFEAPKHQLNKHEVEMQRLIAEVEAKMKSSKKRREIEPETLENTDLNFSETQEFNPETKKVVEKSAQKIEVNKIELIEEKAENKDWKPMNFSGNIPDSLLNQKNAPLKETISEKIANEKAEERPALNVSFFTQETQKNSSEKEEIEEIKSDENLQEKTKLENSNFPKFLDTWQNWLKIDRKTEIKEELTLKPEISQKENIIEKFIQKEPRISKLKEESDFVVKEKDGNISHLMTETLANIYTSQKLFSKAIKAYEILGKKHPKKKDYFDEKIQEIKDLRKNS